MIIIDESGSMPSDNPFIDFGNDENLIGKTNEELMEHILTAENPVFFAGEASGVIFVIDDGEGPNPSIEEIRENYE